MINFFKPKIKILAIMTVAFLLVKAMSAGEVFLGDSPKINPYFIARVLRSPQTIKDSTTSFIASIQSRVADPFGIKRRSIEQQIATNPPKGLLFSTVAKGVYAADDPASGKKYVQLESGTTVQIITQIQADGTKKTYLKVLNK